MSITFVLASLVLFRTTTFKHEHYTHFREGFKALLAVNAFEGLVVLAVCWLVLRQFLRWQKWAVTHIACEQCVSLWRNQKREATVKVIQDQDLHTQHTLFAKKGVCMGFMTTNTNTETMYKYIGCIYSVHPLEYTEAIRSFIYIYISENSCSNKSMHFGSVTIKFSCITTRAGQYIVFLSPSQYQLAQ